MGKEKEEGKGELWDDSALLNAFEHAISTYKKMHRKEGNDVSFNEGKVSSGREEKILVLTDECLEPKSHMDEDDGTTVAPKNPVEVGDTISPTLSDKNHLTDTLALGQHVCSSNGHRAQDAEENCANTLCAEDYNHLVNKYNELEAEKQKVLEQLYQYGDWNYQGYDTSVQGGTFNASQEHQAPAAEASCQTAVCSCRSYMCPFPTTSCTSLAACCSNAICGGSKPCNATSAIAQTGCSVPLEDSDLVKIAMGAAERALSSLKAKTSSISEVNDEKENKQETTAADLAQNNDSKTDLTVVLNAWFSAGFYTGKFLSEQSISRK